MCKDGAVKVLTKLADEFATGTTSAKDLVGRRDEIMKEMGGVAKKASSSSMRICCKCGMR